VKTFILLLGLPTILAFSCRADEGVPKNYKERIEWTLAKKHPQYRAFYCEYYGPAPATLKEEKQPVFAVCCDWGGKLRSGAIPLMISRQIFVFDGAKLSETSEQAIEWLQENPIPERKRINQSPDRKR